jgi:tetratricopeptide (TPR) repeat protein/transcriptional regulator with XRE-family HTH domain
MSQHSPHTLTRSASSLAGLRERLAQARYQHDWSQQELADLLGTTPLNISRWERGLTSPNPYFRHKLCALFGLSEIELGLRSDPSLPSPLSPSLAVGEAHEAAASRFPLTDPFLPLPSAVPLVGRAALLTQLKGRLGATRAIALSALHGLPGVGKTALALELAYDPELRAHYPDGLLWAALGPQPNLLALLSHWGQLLGIGDDEAVRLSTPQAWARTLRATIGTRRLLFVLDDAWSLEEALACRVGGPQCAYVLTTRLPQLAQSFALTEAHTVETLGEEASLELLRQLAPWALAQAAEPLRALTQALGGLPLALSLVGHTLRQQTHDRQPRRLQAVLERLQDRLARLQLAQPQDGTAEMGGQRSLEAVIHSSAEQLSVEARQAWAALALLPGRPQSFSEEAAEAVSGRGVETLDELSDAGVLEAVGEARYTFHQVLADYGRAQLSGQAEQEARRRLIAYSLCYAEEHSESYAALEQEASVLAAGLEVCSEQREQEGLLRLTLALASSWKARGDYAQAEVWLPRAAEAARMLGLLREETRVRLLQGEIVILRGDYEQTLTRYEQALVLARQAGQAEQICASLLGVGWVAYKWGKHDQAEQVLQEGLALARQQDLLQQQAGLSRVLGVVMTQQGNYMQALTYLQEGLSLARQVGDHELTCNVFNNLGVLHNALGDVAQAARCYLEGLALARQRSYRHLEGLLLVNLGIITIYQGDYEQAERYLQEGLSLARQLGFPEHVFAALTFLGEVAFARGDGTQAERYLQEGLSLASQLGAPAYVCMSLIYLGEAALVQGDYAQAERHLQEGLSQARQLGAPEYVCEALIYLGEAALVQGDYAQAERHLQEALSQARQHGSPVYVGRALNTLGEAALARGDDEQAERHLQEALSQARQHGSPQYVTRILTNLGELACVRGEYVQAEQYLQEGLQLARQTHLPPLLCRTLYQWGLLALQRGQLEVAAATFEEMLATAPEGARLEPAQAQHGLARVAAALGQIGEARQLGEQALATLAAIGHREALQIRPWLASLAADA